MFERTAVLGAGRGLGYELTKLLADDAAVSSLFLSSRRVSYKHPKAEVFHADFTRDQLQVLEKLEVFSPTQIFYAAGGGPYGKFESKNWKDHQWALDVSLIFPAKLLHFASVLRLKGLQRVVFIGSSIAEEKADPYAASYAAAKHGLRGLLSSVVAEGCDIEIKLYSPGYMDTDMIPANALVRQQQGGLRSPAYVAQDVIGWLKSGDTAFHRRS